MNGPPFLLQLSDITKTFGAVRALKGISFDLKPGEVHALMGENGAGKSTLIRIITGAHQPDSGTIRIDGRPVARLTPAIAHQRGIACTYQQPALFPDLSVAENIGLRLEPVTALRRVHWAERQKRAAQLLKRIGARIRPEAEVRSLSMPEQQLVEIACALGAGARIVVLDEPTASLTQQEQDVLFTLLTGLRQSGAGVIYISHRIEEIFAIADRVTVLRDGVNAATRQVGGLQLPNSQTTRAGAQDQSRSLSTSELIRLMVGREVSHIYPPAESAPGEIVLSLKKVGRAASGVKDVSFDVRAGEVVGLAGLVGAGRTELARILFGLTPADEGQIILGGVPVRIHSPQEALNQGIAYVPEDRLRHGVILEMPIAHNITMAIHPRLFPGGWLQFGRERRFALGQMRDLGVKPHGPEARAGALSGGNQQKVSLARWLATEPRLLILDEPTQGVDVGAKSEIHRLIRRLAKRGLAVLMISSELPEVLGMSDRIVVMRGGAVAALLPGATDAPTVLAAALGQTGMTQ